ncbi:MAG TPA: hypothetical protein VFR17_11375 [Mycobacterium sp.]|nr:hypothetical protein [Mycobacterium sp.]
MTHYWLDPVVKTRINTLAVIGTLCSSPCDMMPSSCTTTPIS